MKDEHQGTVILTAEEMTSRAKKLAEVAVFQCSDEDPKSAVILISATTLLAAAALIVKTGKLDPDAMTDVFRELCEGYEVGEGDSINRGIDDTEPDLKGMN